MILLLFTVHIIFLDYRGGLDSENGYDRRLIGRFRENISLCHFESCVRHISYGGYKSTNAFFQPI